MKKVGKLTEARMVLPPEPKIYPLVSDSLFEAKVKFKGRKKLKEDDLPMNRRGRITQAGPAPKVDPKTYQTYNSMTDAKDPNWIQGAEADIERRGTERKCTPITKPGCTGKAKALAKTFKKMAKKRDDSTKAKNEAKDDNWIQGAEADIERRGTEGKCTPITKPGCTGKAKALAKTFKKMAKKRDAKIVSKKEKQNEGEAPPIKNRKFDRDTIVPNAGARDPADTMDTTSQKLLKRWLRRRSKTKVYKD